MQPVPWGSDARPSTEDLRRAPCRRCWKHVVSRIRKECSRRTWHRPGTQQVISGWKLSALKPDHFQVLLAWHLTPLGRCQGSRLTCTGRRWPGPRAPGPRPLCSAPSGWSWLPRSFLSYRAASAPTSGSPWAPTGCGGGHFLLQAGGIS